MSLPYRAGVTGVFVDEHGLVLACQRSDHPDAWQLPQGGIEKGESATEAVRREMQEELGTDAFAIVKKAEKTVSYDFPRDLGVPIARKFRGQQQAWFQLHFIDGGQPDLSKADNEFSACSWMTCSELLQNTIVWKIKAYREGLRLLGLLER